MTLNVQNDHRWVTHISAVAYRSLSQSCQWHSNADQINYVTKVHFKTQD